MATLTVGLTGGLASGKSTVAARLREAGIAVVDADAVVADLYSPRGDGAAAVRDLFGESLLDATGGVDKAALASRVFADEQARERLENAVFPLVRRRFAQIASNTADIVVLEATKLVEAGFADDFDLVVTVEAPIEARIARAVRRGLPAAEAHARIAAQASEAERRAAAGETIDSSGTIRELRDRADELAAELRRRADVLSKPS